MIIKFTIPFYLPRKRDSIFSLSNTRVVLPMRWMYGMGEGYNCLNALLLLDQTGLAQSLDLGLFLEISSLTLSATPNEKMYPAPASP
jgi:hypothetical protein